MTEEGGGGAETTTEMQSPRKDQSTGGTSAEDSDEKGEQSPLKSTAGTSTGQSGESTGSRKDGSAKSSGAGNKSPPKLGRKEEKEDRDPNQPPPELEGFEVWAWRARHQIVYNPIFEPFILTVIVTNCVFLALDNPTNDSKDIRDTVDVAEYIFTTIYIAEMIVKMVAFGFWGEHEEKGVKEAENRDQKQAALAYMLNRTFKNRKEEQKKKETTYVGYFMDGWNVLDFIVVVVGSIIPQIFATSSVSSIRALRILRAIRTIPRVPKLRILVMTLIDSLSGLGVSLILLAFFFVVFGIIGIDFFSGQLQHQCYRDDSKKLSRMLQYSVTDTTYFSFCRSKSDTCDEIVSDLGITGVEYSCLDANRNPNSNMESFDDIFYSLLMVFQTVTLQDWSKVLYDLHFRTGYIAWLWFFPLIFLVSFFALNLMLAVIAVTYSQSRVIVQHEEDFTNNIDEVDMLITQKERNGAQPVEMTITYDNYERYIRVLKQKVSMFEELFQEFSQPAVERVSNKYELTKKQKLRIDTAHRDDDDAKEANHWAAELEAIQSDVNAESQYDLGLIDDDRSSWEYSNRAQLQHELRTKMIHETMASFNAELARAVWQLSKPIPDGYLDGKPDFILWCNKVATSEMFESVMLFIIFLNTIVLGLWWPSMSGDTRSALTIINIVFTIIFCLELLIKLIGLGFAKWSYDKFNLFDAVIVVVSLIDLFVSLGTNSGTSNLSGAILAFRSLRVLRILRLLHQIRSLRILLNSIIQSFEPVSFLFLIMTLFLFMFGVLGVQMFAGKVIKRKRRGGEFAMLTRPWRFDNLWYSMVTFVQLFSGDGWPSVMGDLVDATSPAAALIPVIAVLIGLWIFKNMFLAILINRMSNQDDIQFLIDDLIRETRQLQVTYKGDINEGTKRCVELVDKFRRQRMVSKAGNKHAGRVRKIEQRAQIIGTSLRYFRPDHPVRMKLHQMVTSEWFEYSINGMIVLNCFFLALRNPKIKGSSDLGQTLRILDFIFTTVFIIELILKVVAFGLWESSPDNARGGAGAGRTEEDNLRTHQKKNFDEEEDAESKMNKLANRPCENAYLKSWWNRLDAFVVFVAILGLIWPEIRVLRGLRAVRPVRIAIRIPQVRVVVKALNNSLSNIFNGLVFAFFLMFVLSIIGVRLFGGRLGRCVYEGSPFQLADDIKDKKECNNTDGVDWVNAGFNFDNVFAGLLAVFKISTFSNWFEDLAIGMAAKNKQNSQPKPFNSPAAALYYILVVFVGGFFLWNILISVVVDSFNRIKRDEESNALLTKTQAMWVRKKRYLGRFPLKNPLKHPRKPRKNAWLPNVQTQILPLRTWCFNVVTQPWFEYVIVGLIMANTIFLMSQHESQPSGWTTGLEVLEVVFIVFYSIEGVMKLLAFGFETYFSDWWNVFDFVIILASIIGVIFSELSGAAVVRLLRVARLVRLIKRAPALRAQFLTLVYATPSLINIGFLLFVIFFIFGIFGVELFGRVYYNDGYGNPVRFDGNDGITKSINFQDFSRSLLILYRVATNDNWGSIMLAAGAQGKLCDRDDFPDNDTLDWGCGNLSLSIMYFVLFGIFGTLVMVNLFIAVILDTYQDNISFETKMGRLMAPGMNDSKGVAEEWLECWKELDAELNNKVRGRLPVKYFIATLKKNPRLVGLMLEALGLRLNVEGSDGDQPLDYNAEENYDEIERRSTLSYGRLEFVGSANALDSKVEVTNDHLNAIFKTRRLRLLCTLIHRGTYDEKLVVYYSEALFAIASLIVGPEFRLLPYDSNRYVHLSDWWEEQLEEAMPSF